MAFKCSSSRSDRLATGTLWLEGLWDGPQWQVARVPEAPALRACWKQCCDQAGRYEFNLCRAATFACGFHYSVTTQPSIQGVQCTLFSRAHMPAMPFGVLVAKGKVGFISALLHCRWRFCQFQWSHVPYTVGHDCGNVAT